MKSISTFTWHDRCDIKFLPKLEIATTMLSKLISSSPVFSWYNKNISNVLTWPIYAIMSRCACYQVPTWLCKWSSVKCKRKYKTHARTCTVHTSDVQYKITRTTISTQRFFHEMWRMPVPQPGHLVLNDGVMMGRQTKATDFGLHKGFNLMSERTSQAFSATFLHQAQFQKSLLWLKPGPQLVDILGRGQTI